VRGRRAGANIRLEGYGHGYVIWPLYAVIKRMSTPRELRALGKTLVPHAHELAERLLHVAANPQRSERELRNLISEAVLILLAQPAPQRGRPPKPSTAELQRLLAKLGSKRGAARAVSGKTGESFHNLRRRLRSKKPRKPKRKGGT
jgi:hypothetical protein